MTQICTYPEIKVYLGFCLSKISKLPCPKSNSWFFPNYLPNLVSFWDLLRLLSQLMALALTFISHRPSASYIIVEFFHLFSTLLVWAAILTCYLWWPPKWCLHTTSHSCQPIFQKKSRMIFFFQNNDLVVSSPLIKNKIQYLFMLAGHAWSGHALESPSASIPSFNVFSHTECGV